MTSSEYLYVSKITTMKEGSMALAGEPPPAGASYSASLWLLRRMTPEAVLLQSPFSGYTELRRWELERLLMKKEIRPKDGIAGLAVWNGNSKAPSCGFFQREMPA